MQFLGTNEDKQISIRAYRKNDTRQRLIEAARRLFKKRGFQATGMYDIAEAAGISRTTIYLHFDSKTELLREIVNERWRTLHILCEKFGSFEEWSRPTIRAWIAEVFERCEKHAKKTRLDLREIPSGVVNEGTLQMHVYVKAIMRNRALWSHFTEDEAERRVRFLIIELCQNIWAGRDGTLISDVEPVLDTLSDIWFTILRADHRIKSVSPAYEGLFESALTGASAKSVAGYVRESEAYPC